MSTGFDFDLIERALKDAIASAAIERLRVRGAVRMGEQPAEDMTEAERVDRDSVAASHEFARLRRAIEAASDRTVYESTGGEGLYEPETMGRLKVLARHLDARGDGTED